MDRFILWWVAASGTVVLAIACWSIGKIVEHEAELASLKQRMNYVERVGITGR